MLRTDSNNLFKSWTSYLKFFRGNTKSETALIESKQSVPSLPKKPPIPKNELVDEYLKLYKMKKQSVVLDFFVAYFEEFTAKNQDKIIFFFFKKFKKFPHDDQKNILKFLRNNPIKLDYFFLKYFLKFDKKNQDKIIRHFFQRYIKNNSSKTNNDLHLKKIILVFLSENNASLHKKEQDQLLEALFEDLKVAQQKELPLTILNAAENVYKEYDAMIEKQKHDEEIEEAKEAEEMAEYPPPVYRV